ncbi:hypothetical protein [Streptomyces sp. S1A1-7]|uniref:hypothetical protein n=1 Tax=Streptomyces sp. S1A1-7 TaxID=2594459 RepID=UPI001F0749A6|nr:hypothetical protein [Streptomyces sp. S1A1-7]
MPQGRDRAPVSRSLRTTALAALPSAVLAAVHYAPVVSTFGPLRDRTMPRLSGRAHADRIVLNVDAGPDPLSTPFFRDCSTGAGCAPPSSC